AAKYEWCGGRSRSGARPRTQQLLADLRALAAVRLRLAEQVGELGVAVAGRVLDVDLQAQRVAQASLYVPDQVVVLVLRAGPGACFLSGIAHLLLAGLVHYPPAPDHACRGA